MMIDTVCRFIAEELKPLEDEIENQVFLAKDMAQAVHDKAKASGTVFRQCAAGASATKRPNR